MAKTGLGGTFGEVGEGRGVKKKKSKLSGVVVCGSSVRLTSWLLRLRLQLWNRLKAAAAACRLIKQRDVIWMEADRVTERRFQALMRKLQCAGKSSRSLFFLHRRVFTCSLCELRPGRNSPLIRPTKMGLFSFLPGGGGGRVVPRTFFFFDIKITHGNALIAFDNNTSAI